MDTSDPDIRFDEAGVCNHCRDFDARWRETWLPDERGEARLAALLKNIRETGRGRRYDCAIGLSGGADSSFVTLKAFEWGLRPLVVHVDTGWNSQEAVANIERLTKCCGFELHTHVVDWAEMRDLQLAYLKSGVPNQDVPQDHAIFASLYSFCVANGISRVISGGNIATEGIFPESWHADNMDLVNLRAIHRRFGIGRLRRFPQIGMLTRYVINPYLRGFRTLAPLNFMPYDRDRVVGELQEACGWQPYGRKHGESRFTKLFQNHFLPTRYGFDKRRPHLSSMIASGQITREEAIRRLNEPLYDPVELEADIAFLCNKLGISRSDFDEFIMAPHRHHTEFATHDRMYRRAKWIKRRVESLLGIHLSPSVR